MKLSTSKNTTVIISDFVSEKYYSEIAKKSMSPIYLAAEQVGFLLPPDNKESIIKLQMSGGEFCGNGVLALGALSKYLGIVEDQNFLIEISGADSPLQIEILNNKLDKMEFEVKAAMPVDYSSKNFICHLGEENIQGRIIHLKGISHFILKGSKYFNEDLLQKIMKELSKNLSTEALGIIPYYIKNKKHCIKPFIFVRKNNSLVFEKGCGSGTLALGLHLVEKLKENIDLEVKQPGSKIKVEIKLNDNTQICKNFLKGKVKLTTTGTLFISR